ncbi:MAG: hypothetical protein LQ347_003553 [Umbilicaria vellea]|nr:MAG: hypothetical protein LQ347_003553 [Umbilicaria vellea]
MASSSSNKAPAEPFLVQFYSPSVNGPDRRGRTLTDILSWPYERLERVHDYIQTLFPTPDPSAHNAAAPLVDRATFQAFHQRSDLRDRLRESFVCMLRFYGLELQVKQILVSKRFIVVPGTNFLERAPLWVVQTNHNHQRITRIIRSLRILGLEDEAAAFYFRLERIFRANRDMIGRPSLVYWARAAQRPLFFPPQDTEYDGKGKDFLLELYSVEAQEAFVKQTT